MKYLDELISKKEVFINFMKAKYPFYQNSNVFFRDIQYAIKSYFKRKNKFLKYSETEKLALAFTSHLESTKEFIKVSNNAWKVNFSLKNNVKLLTEENVNPK